MKLTNKQILTLNDTVYHLERALSYINKDSTVVGMKNGSAGSDCFKNDKENFTISLINKEYGSNLTGLSMGIDKLKQFIDYNSKV